MGGRALLQGVFLTQEWNLGLLHCRQILYWLRCQGSRVYDKGTVNSYPLWKTPPKLPSHPLVLQTFMKNQRQLKNNIRMEGNPPVLTPLLPFQKPD